MALTVDPSSTLLRGHEADLALAAQVLQYQLLHHVAPVYERVPPSVAFYPDPEHVPCYAFQLTIFDNPDVPGAAGYHDEEGFPFGKVFVQPSLDAGSGVLTGRFPLSRVICHEGIELFGNPAVNLWVDKWDGTDTPHELCDAVEDDDLHIKLPSGKSYPGSNFVMPRWFDGRVTTGPFDFMGTTKSPFEMTANGYMIIRNHDDNSISQIFGANVPDWKQKLKAHPAVRPAIMRL